MPSIPIVFVGIGALIFSVTAQCPSAVAETITETQDAIKKCAANEAQVPFAEDFAIFFANLSGPKPKVDESILSRTACMIVGARRYPDLKTKIDQIVADKPIGKVALRYGEPVPLPFVDLTVAANKAFIGIGMTASRQRVECGGQTIYLKEEDLRPPASAKTADGRRSYGILFPATSLGPGERIKKVQMKVSCGTIETPTRVLNEWSMETTKTESGGEEILAVPGSNGKMLETISALNGMMRVSPKDFGCFRFSVDVTVQKEPDGERQISFDQSKLKLAP